jgi:predicted metal-dependent hydrolase
MRALRVAVAMFNAGEFFEQHEVLEELWHAEPGPIRELYQGILQVGVGFHHLGNGNYHGAVALLGRGLARLRTVAPDALGLDVAGLVVAASAAHERILELGPTGLARFDATRIPKIRWRTE